MFSQVGKVIPISFLFYFTTMQAIIIGVDYVKNTMPELKAEKFVLFSDYHVHMPADKEQLTALTQVLLKRDRESKQEMHILVEQQAGESSYYSVIGHLRDTLKDCAHTTVQNIEMRCFTGAACYILDPNRDPDTICPDIFYDSAYSACRVGGMIMREVDIELARVKGEIDDWLQALPPWYAQAVSTLQSEYDDLRQDYERGCNICNVVPETNVLELSRLLYKKDSKSREYLYAAIDELSSVLFDMHILKSILSLKNPDIIALVAGGWHTMRVLGKLERLGNPVIARYGKTWGGDIKPLSQRYLDIDPGACSSCWWCLVQ